MKIKRYLYVVFTIIALGGLAAAPALADTNTSTQGGSWFGHMWQGMFHRDDNNDNGPDQMMTGSGWGNRAPVIFGKVSAINGNTITVSGLGSGSDNSSGTSYTVDASGATVTKNGASGSVSDISVGDVVSVQGTLSGTNVTATAIRDGMMMGRPDQGPFLTGKVTNVSGNTITVSGHQGLAFGEQDKNNSNSTTTFTVDASNAKIYKNGNTGSVSDIAVGDNVMVQGTTSGTNITATIIRDGIMPRPGFEGQGQGLNQNSLSQISGNGEPIIAGTVSSVSGSTIGITNKAGTYNVNASGATITKPGISSPSVSDVAVGDTVIVQGTINGTNITATSVIVENHEQPVGSSGNAPPPPHKGFFGSIGSFFARLFGF